MSKEKALSGYKVLILVLTVLMFSLLLPRNVFARGIEKQDNGSWIVTGTVKHSSTDTYYNTSKVAKKTAKVLYCYEPNYSDIYKTVYKTYANFLYQEVSEETIYDYYTRGSDLVRRNKSVDYYTQIVVNPNTVVDKRTQSNVKILANPATYTHTLQKPYNSSYVRSGSQNGFAVKIKYTVSKVRTFYYTKGSTEVKIIDRTTTKARMYDIEFKN